MSLNTILATAPLTTTNYILKATGTTIGNSLIFDNGTNVGIGNIIPAYKLDVSGSGRFISYLDLTGGASFGPQLNIFSNNQSTNNITLAQGYANGTDNIGYLYNRATADFVFGTSNIERMRITSGGNIGIGTSSPAYTLDVSGTGNYSGVLRVSAATGFAVGSIAGYRRIEYTGTTFSMLTNADGYAGLSAGAGTFSTSLVIGSTDSTWNLTTSNKLQIQNSMLVGYSTTGTFLAMNLNYNSAWKYISNGYASIYSQDTGEHVFYTSTSGTAAATATLNERMKITNAGLVGINVTPSFLLDISDTTVGTFNTIAQFRNTDYTAGNRSFIRVRAQATIGGSSSAYFGCGQDSNLYIIANNSARGGDLIISGATGAATFANSVHIASNVEIGNGYLSTSAGSGTTYSSKLSTTYAYPYIDTFLDSIAGPSYQSRLRFRLNANGAMEDKLILWYDGTVTFSGLAGAGTRTVTVTAGGNLSTSSDSKLKQEDKEYTIGGLKELLQITPRAYKWLDDIEKRGEEAVTELGFFADEVAPIIPSAAPKGNDDMYGFNDRALMAVMVKSIQELTERLIKLESK